MDIALVYRDAQLLTPSGALLAKIVKFGLRQEP